ncbi:MAG: hypothetical protein C0459_08345 [Chitinophaga sp.]|jgi:antitoxin component YwqK of YwqJK toxin-antitoxin module|nr:hypothetical protein [Chitinophaga sp.]
MNRKIIIVLTLSCLLISCFNNTPPDVLVMSNDATLKNVNTYWMYNDKKFNGYIIEKDKDKIVSKLPVINGKENGIALGWYASGKKKFQRVYTDGNRQGLHIGWYENDSVSFIYHFKDDKLDGEQTTYYNNGQLWQQLHYVNGYEEGKQKAWSKDGRVVNNFTVKNGKLYGVIGRFDCMQVAN